MVGTREKLECRWISFTMKENKTKKHHMGDHWGTYMILMCFSKVTSTVHRSKSYDVTLRHLSLIFIFWPIQWLISIGTKCLKIFSETTLMKRCSRNMKKNEIFPEYPIPNYYTLWFKRYLTSWNHCNVFPRWAE